MYNDILKSKEDIYEYQRDIELEFPTEIGEIQIGLMFHWGTYDQDMNHEPLVFLLEGGMKE